ncbi:hypothetical protein MMC08_001758 [Hypocenomyce scalaris]|nr:hypothetical protein [Hypocenomyce scalaris]
MSQDEQAVKEHSREYTRAKERGSKSALALSINGYLCKEPIFEELTKLREVRDNLEADKEDLEKEHLAGNADYEARHQMYNVLLDNIADLSEQCGPLLHHRQL